VSKWKQPNKWSSFKSNVEIGKGSSSNRVATTKQLLSKYPVMDHPGDILTAYATEQALVERIARQEQQIADALAPYEPVSATLAWFETLRYIEECINLITVDWDDEEFEQELLRFPVTQMMLDPDRLVQLRRRVTARFSEKFCNRFGNLLVQGMAIGTGFAISGLFDVAAGFHTVGSTIGYLQSRRRHFVGLLHLLPKACRGHLEVHPLDTLNIFLPVV
jgi:hypothetical protein